MKRGVVFAIVTMVLVSALPLLAQPTEAATPVPAWQQSTPLPINITQAAVVTDGEVIYVMGGYTKLEDGPINTSWSFNTQTGQWSRLANMVMGVRGAAAAVAPDGRVFVFGGINATGKVDTIQIYDPDTNTWIKRSNGLIDAVWEAKAVYLESLQLFYIIGGEVTSQGSITVQWISLDSSTSWKYISGPGLLPAGKLAGALLVAPNASRLWYVGGAGLYESPSYSILEFDPAAPSWSVVEYMPSAVAALGAARGADGLYYLFGGGDSVFNDGAGQAAGYYYNPYTDEWGDLPDMVQPTKYHGGVATSDGRIWAVGGVNDTTVLGTVQSLRVMSFSVSAPSTVKTGEPFMVKVTVQTPFSDPVRFTTEAYIQGGDGTTYGYAEVTSATADPFAFELKLPQGAPSGSYALCLQNTFVHHSDADRYQLAAKRASLAVTNQGAISEQISALQAQILYLNDRVNSADVESRAMISELWAKLNTTASGTEGDLSEVSSDLAALAALIEDIEAHINELEANTEGELADLSDQTTSVQSTVDGKADSVLMYVSMAMMAVVIVLLVLVLMMVRKKA